MKRNQGFSLIELIVTVAILAVAVGLVVGSLNLIYIRQVQNCANDVGALLSKTRVCALSRAAEVSLVLRQEEDGVYAEYREDGVALSTDRVGTRSVTVSLVWDGLEHPLSDLGSFALSFERGTGAFSTLGDAHTRAHLSTFSGTSTAQCTRIVLSGGGVQRVIELYGPTGKHRVVLN